MNDYINKRIITIGAKYGITLTYSNNLEFGKDEDIPCYTMHEDHDQVSIIKMHTELLSLGYKVNLFRIIKLVTPDE